MKAKMNKQGKAAAKEGGNPTVGKQAQAMGGSGENMIQPPGPKKKEGKKR